MTPEDAKEWRELFEKEFAALRRAIRNRPLDPVTPEPIVPRPAKPVRSTRQYDDEATEILSLMLANRDASAKAYKNWETEHNNLEKDWKEFLERAAKLFKP
jgi:hypothetical protein